MSEQIGLSVQCDFILKNGQRCGIQAIGRCATCQRAFCVSHQAHGIDIFGYPIPSHDLCLQCMQDQLEAEEKREEERDAPFFFFYDGEALAMMRKSDKPKAKVYRVSRTLKTSFFRTKEIVSYGFYGYGWGLGEFMWHDGARTHSGNYITILMDAGRNDNSLTNDTRTNLGLIPVKPYADGYEYDLPLGMGGWTRPDLVLLGQAVRNLARTSS